MIDVTALKAGVVFQILSARFIDTLLCLCGLYFVLLTSICKVTSDLSYRVNVREWKRNAASHGSVKATQKHNICKCMLLSATKPGI